MSEEMDSLRQRLEERSTEELLEIVRAHDTDEWLPEIFPLAEEILRHRGIAIATEAAPASEDAEAPSPDDPFVAIAGFATVVESEACQSALTAAGFTVVGADKFLLQVDPALGPALGGFRLGVPASQAEDARQFLAAAETGELSEGMLECQACGSTEVDAQKDSTRSGTFVNTLLVGPVVRDVSVSFRCRACGEKWE
jgi:hypothetical protein